MLGYIYFITNNETGEKYVGKTTNIKRRKNEHFNKLKINRHINKKMQNSWNKYGEKAFAFDFIEFDISSEQELNEKEIYYIKKYDSFNNGYNLTLGGDGGNTRGKLSFEDYCFIYIGCQWKGMSLKIAKFLDIDSSTVSSVLRKKSYLWYKEAADKLDKEEKEYIINKFKETFSIPKDKEYDIQKESTSLTEDDYFYCFCIASSYGRGIETILANFFDKHKSFLTNGIKNKTKGKVYFAHQRFLNLNKDEILKIGQQKFEEWELQKYSKTLMNLMYHDKWRY